MKGITNPRVFSWENLKTLLQYLFFLNSWKMETILRITTVSQVHEEVKKPEENKKALVKVTFKKRKQKLNEVLEKKEMKIIMKYEKTTNTM